MIFWSEVLEEGQVQVSWVVSFFFGGGEWFLISEEMLPLGYYLKKYFNQTIVILQYGDGFCQTLT